MLKQYKSLSQSRVQVFEETFRLQKSKHCHQTRHHEHWYTHRTRTNYGFQTLNYALYTLLNRCSLANYCDRLPSYERKKRSFYKSILSVYALLMLPFAVHDVNLSSYHYLSHVFDTFWVRYVCVGLLLRMNFFLWHVSC